MVKKTPSQDSTTATSSELPNKIELNGTEYNYDSQYKKWFHKWISDWRKCVEGFSLQDLQTIAAGKALLGAAFFATNVCGSFCSLGLPRFPKKQK
jgi:hypothetical protein